VLAGLAGLLLELAGAALLAAGRLPPNGDDPPELPELPPLEPPPKDELPPGVAGRFGVDELPPGEPGLLPAGLLPNGDDPPELPDPLGLLDPLDPPNEPPAGRFAPNPPPELPDPPGEVGLLPAGRLPPNDDDPPLDGLEPPGDVGRLPLGDEPNGGRAADELELLGGGLVRPPAPGRFEVGRLPKPLLEPPNGFTRDELDDEPLSSSSSSL